MSTFLTEAGLEGATRSNALPISVIREKTSPVIQANQETTVQKAITLPPIANQQTDEKVKPKALFETASKLKKSSSKPIIKPLSQTKPATSQPALKVLQNIY